MAVVVVDAGPLIGLARVGALTAATSVLQLLPAYIGTAHTLLLAERRSIIDDAEALIGRMAKHGYRISSSILQYLRSQAS